MTDTEKAALERRIDELCAENDRLRKIQSHSFTLIESLMHCMSDMDKGIGCDGCDSNLLGICILNNRLDEYEQLRSGGEAVCAQH